MRLDASEHAVSSGLDFDDGFVGFDFEEDLAFCDGIALFLDPRDDLSGLLRHL